MKCETFPLSHVLGFWRSWHYPGKHFPTSKLRSTHLLLAESKSEKNSMGLGNVVLIKMSLYCLYLGSFQVLTVSKQSPYPTQSLTLHKAELDIDLSSVTICQRMNFITCTNMHMLLFCSFLATSSKSKNMCQWDFRWFISSNQT